MSYTELFKVNLKGDIEIYQEFHNSHRGAMLVWKNMCERYLPDTDFFSLFRDLSPVWALWKNKTVDTSDRIVMAATFDRVMVKKQDLQRVVDAMRSYGERYEDPGTIPQQADAIEKLITDDDCQAICWNQTSVNADAWVTRGESEDLQDYNINRDSGHWFLFQEFDNI